jgi:hypothetical protein
VFGAVRDEIHSDVLEKGYDAGRGTFTQSYGSKALDACALLYDMVQERRAAHMGYDELDRAVAGAVKRPVGDRWPKDGSPGHGRWPR